MWCLWIGKWVTYWEVIAQMEKIDHFALSTDSVTLVHIPRLIAISNIPKSCIISADVDFCLNHVHISQILDQPAVCMNTFFCIISSKGNRISPVFPCLFFCLWVSQCSHCRIKCIDLDENVKPCVKWHCRMTSVGEKDCEMHAGDASMLGHFHCSDLQFISIWSIGDF